MTKMYAGFHEVIKIETPVIKEDEILISHIGDGEYNFNIFGSAHKDFNKFLDGVAKYLHIPVSDLIICEYNSAYYSNRILIGHIFKIEEEGSIHIILYAVVTIEKIDPEKFPVGE
jgi:hypothetical protein